MENDIIEEDNIITKIIVLAVFLGVLLLAVVVIIGALNQGNSQAGTVVSGSISENLYNLDSSGQNLIVSSINGIKCSVSSISLNGTLLPASNYSVNNCNVAYTP